MISFDAAHNQLVSIESLLSNCILLQDLDLSHNRLNSTNSCSLDDDLHPLRHLRRLILNHNQLTRVPRVDEAVQLRFLDIASNRINSIPDFVGIRLKRLEVLNAAANQLVVIPASLCRETSHLKKLVLINNRIEHLPCFIYRLQGLRVLQLEGNPLETPKKGTPDTTTKLWGRFGDACGSFL